MRAKLIKLMLIFSVFLLFLATQYAKANLHPITIAQSKYHIQSPLGALQIENLIIFTMLQDHQGFIWLGTSGGLLRYDGYDFKSIHSEFEKMEVWSIVQDKNKDLWFGTRNKGLVRLGSHNQKITRFKFDKNNLQSLSHNTIRKLMLSRHGELYIATSGGGLNKFSADKESFERILLGNVSNSETLYLRDIVEGTRDDLWIATRDYGVIKLNRQTKRITHFQESASDNNTLSSNITQALTFDETTEQLWIGTWGGGLNVLDTKTGKVRRLFKIDQTSKMSDFGPQTIVSMIRDNKNSLWLGTLNGVVYFDLTNEKFHSLKDIHPQFPALGESPYYALMIDQLDSLWLGNWRGKIYFIGLENHNFYLHNLSKFFPEIIKGKSIKAVYKDDADRLWLGTQTSGVVVLDGNMKLIEHFKHQANNPNSLSDNAITKIEQLSNGDIWIGTVNGGVNKYQKDSNDFISYSAFGGGETGVGDYISTLFEYRDNLLLGTVNSIYKFNLQTEKISKLDLPSEGKADASILSADVIFQDSKSRLWFATSEGIYLKETDEEIELVLGFNEFLSQSQVSFSNVSSITEDKQQNIWFSTNTGLWQIEVVKEKSQGKKGLTLNKRLSATLSGMQQDSSGSLWLVSNNNLYRFSPESYQYETFSVLDGIKGGFNNSSHFLSRDNHVYFGSNYGLLTFKPEDVVATKQHIKVTIVDLLLANQSVQAHSNSKILTMPIYQTQQLTLPHDENIISFDISTLDFRQPNKAIYQHRLLGFDETWIESTAKNRRITYTNLATGNYTLSIRGAYSFAPEWGESTDLAITILPPLWWTWWAKFTYLLFALLLLKISYHIHKHRILFTAYEQAAITDSLTGLKNRRFLESTIDQDISQSMRLKKDNTPNADVTFFFTDIDWFKKVNDDYGHESGDLVLKQFAKLLQDVFRSSDHIIRWGGEEFLIVSRFTQANRAQEMAERLRTKVSNTEFKIANGDKINKTVSIGFTTIPFDRAASCRLSCSQLIEVADKALYYVKEHGRDGWAGISAGENFNLQNFDRIGDFELIDRVESGELVLIHNLPNAS